MRTLLLALTILLPTVASAQLNGFYTIGGSSPDYATISAAVADLNAQGVSGPTRFAIRAGTYTEQISIDAITGTSAADTVQFRAANPNNRPTIRFNGLAANNYVWRIVDSDHVKLRNLDLVATGGDTNARVLVVEGDSDDLSVAGCTLTGLAGVTTDDGTLLHAVTNQADRLTVTGSTFTEGYRGIDTGNGTIPYPPGHFYHGNTFSGQYDAGIYASGVSAVISENVISDDAGASAFYTGIEGTLSSSSEITGNDIRLIQGARGIFTELTSQKLIANNTISLRSPNGEAGIYLADNALRVDVLHNTVRVGSATGTGVALFKEDFGFPTSLADLDIKNNLLLHYASGTALEIENPAEVDSLDYNDLFRTGGGTLVAWGGTNYATLAAYQSGTGQGANSISKGVTFVSASGGDLHLAGDSEDDQDLIGTDVGISEDIDGDARATMNPKMGADEGFPFFPLSGAYSVGLGGISDFDDPFEAVDYLNRFGTSGPVRFDILAFDYTGQAVIEDFPRFGAADDVVTFRGNFIDEPGFPRPTLRYAATSSADNYILRIDGADFVSIEDLEFEATGAGTFGRLIVIEGDADDISITGCTFDGPDVAPNSAGTLVYSATNQAERLTVSDNIFNDGYRGLRTGQSAPFPEGHIYHGNTFIGQNNAGLYANGVADAQITENVVSDEASVSTSYVGIFGQLGGGTLNVIEGNVIQVQKGARGMAFGLTTPKLVANNFVTLRSPNGTAGIELSASATTVKVYHNTVLVTDAGVALLDRDNTSLSGTEYLNNLLINEGGGPALVVEESTDITASDYNDFYTTGATLVSYEGVNYATLAGYQAASSRDANSISKAVTFVDAAGGDLHLDGPSDGDNDLAGTFLTEVPGDIDGQMRNDPPYIGADEASGLTPPPNYDLVATNTSPLTVAPGGSIQFDYSITNNTANPATGNLWFAASPGGFDGIIVSGTLPGGQTFNGSYMQPVPGFTPPGTYTYNLNIGNYPGLIVDSETFTVTVTGSPREGGADSWTVTDATPWPTFEDEAEAGPEASSEALPDAFALEAAYPNPFTHSATIGIALPEAADVRVSVYDVLGREVAVLVDGPVEAGRHTAQFEAAGLASGVYLVRMVTSGFAHVQRVTLAH